MGLHNFVFAFIAICYLTILLPHHGSDAQTTNSYDRNRIDLNDVNQNQYGRGRYSQQSIGPQLQQQQQQQQLNQGNRYNDSNRNIPNPNDPSTFYDNSNRYSYNRNPAYSGYGGFNGLDDIDPNHMCPEHWIAYRASCLRFIK